MIYRKSKPKNSKKAVKTKSTNLYDSSVSELIKLATIVFNRHIRNRDLKSSEFFICISCKKPKHKSQCECGHYMPSTYSQLRFNEDNCHAECHDCNCGDINHLVGYRKNLINKIGMEKVLWLESHNLGNSYKWDKSELIDIINKYKI